MERVAQYLNQIETEIGKRSFSGHPAELYDPLNYMMLLGGKRLRPLYLLLANEAVGGNPEKVMHAALAIEVFHNFTLMHDDIMDNAPKRRGQDSVYVRWGVPTAILSGDLMLVEAYKLICETDTPKLKAVLALFSKTAAEVCEGQQLDMNFEAQSIVNTDDYIEMIRLKTAVLLAAALKMGALLGEADDSIAQGLYDYGIHIGIGFQLMDDILDIYGDEKMVGKRTGGDILSDKKTFLLLKTIELANSVQKEMLNQWIGKTTDKPDEKIAAVKTLMDVLQIRQIALEKSHFYFESAEHILDGLDIAQDKKDLLRTYTLWLKARIS